MKNYFLITVTPASDLAILSACRAIEALGGGWARTMVKGQILASVAPAAPAGCARKIEAVPAGAALALMGNKPVCGGAWDVSRVGEAGVKALTGATLHFGGGRVTIHD